MRVQRTKCKCARTDPETSAAMACPDSKEGEGYGRSGVVVALDLHLVGVRRLLLFTFDGELWRRSLWFCGSFSALFCFPNGSGFM